MRWALLAGMLFLGSYVWAQEVIVRTLVDGTVVRQAVETGQTVNKGALLLVVDPAAWQARVAAAEAEVEQARLKLQDVERDLREKQDLYDRAVLAKRPLERMQTRFDLARQALKAAEARLREVKVLGRYYYIRAPFNGQVTRIYAPYGSTVYRGMALIGLERKQ